MRRSETNKPALGRYNKPDEAEVERSKANYRRQFSDREPITPERGQNTLPLKGFRLPDWVNGQQPLFCLSCFELLCNCVCPEADK